MKYFAILVLLSCLSVTGYVAGHSGANGIVKERMDAMKDMGDRTKIVGDMFKGKIQFDRAALIEATDTFVLHGSKMLELFPDTEISRTGRQTEALPVIWEEWDDFKAQVDLFVSQSKALQSTVTSVDDLGQLKVAFFKTTKSCSNCHKRYRKPKD